MNCSSLNLRALSDDKFKSPACVGYPPSPLRVQRIVLMNQIEKINSLFHDDEYEPGASKRSGCRLGIGGYSLPRLPSELSGGAVQWVRDVFQGAFRQRKIAGITGGNIRRGFNLLDVSLVESLAKLLMMLGGDPDFGVGMSAWRRVLPSPHSSHCSH
jgi:hypothetical protein